MGTPFYQQKEWWKSRTIWTGIVGFIFSGLSLFGLLPEMLSQEVVVETILGLVSISTIIFRSFATKKIVMGSEIPVDSPN